MMTTTTATLPETLGLPVSAQPICCGRRMLPTGDGAVDEETLRAWQQGVVPMIVASDADAVALFVCPGCHSTHR